MNYPNQPTQSFFDRIIAGAVTVSGGALLVMMLIGAADVILENVFNQPLPGTLEATEALMAIVVFLALARTQQAGGHIRVDLITRRLGENGRRRSARLGHGFSMLFYGLLAWQGGLYAWQSIAVKEYESGIISFPVYPAKAIMALGLAIMAIHCLRNVIAWRNTPD